MPITQQVMMASYAASTLPVPSTLSNIWDWWEASRETGLVNGDPIGTLHGQKAGHNWVQAGGQKPVYDTSNALNGNAVATATGGDHFWNAGPDFSGFTAAHIFIIVITEHDPATDIQQTGLWDLSTSATSTHYPFTDGLIYDGAFSTTRQTVGDPTPLLTSWRVYEVVSTSSEWTAKLDGTQIFTTGTNTVGGKASPSLMAGNGFAFRGKTAGFYVANVKMTTQRASLISYINTRFALSVS